MMVIICLTLVGLCWWGLQAQNSKAEEARNQNKDLCLDKTEYPLHIGQTAQLYFVEMFSLALN